ncbi:MAG: cyanophycinase [Fimbriiglobus sp.]
MLLSVISVIALSLSAWAEAPKEQVALPGSLVIVGGGGIPDSVRDEFFRLAGGAKAKIVVIPTASADADKLDQAASFLERWQKLKPASVVLLHTRDKKTADTDAFIKPLAEATAVWFSGGDQSRIIEAYQGTKTEAAFRAVLARGGVLGGTSAGAAIMSDPMITGGTMKANLDQGFGFLPGVIVDQHFVARKREARLAGVLTEKPGYVGLGIDEATAIVVTGRTVKVVGDSTVTAMWSKSSIHEARVDVLKSGETLDLFQIRRAALARAAKEPFPPAKLARPEVPKGSLVIVGGGGLPKSIMNRFFDLAGGKDSLIVFVPTASEREPADGDAADLAFLKKLGATNVKVLHTRDRKTANDPKFSEMLLEAKGVWFGGGRQWRFVEAYEGTLTEKRFHTVLERGGVIGGTSAGASIQSEYMPRGHPLGNMVMAAEGYERGFGYLPGCAVDQHFFARKRTGDMVGLMKQYPQLLGIGIDEATAIVVKGHIAEVIGETQVGFYDGTKPVVVVKTGGQYDLKARKSVEGAP